MAIIDTPLMELIHTKGFSVLALAEASGIPNSTLRRRIADGNFTVRELRKVAQALGVSSALILSLSESSVEAIASAA